MSESADSMTDSGSPVTGSTGPIPESADSTTESAASTTESASSTSEIAGSTNESAPLRVLHIAADEETPGEADQVLALMEGLAALGHAQSLMTAAGSALEVEARLRGLEVAPLGLPSIAQLSRGFDLVHAHDSRAHSMAAATARAPVVVSRRLAKAVLRSPAARWKYRRTAHFIAASHDIERVLLNAGIAPERVSLLCDDVDAPGIVEGTLGIYRKVLAPPQPESSSS